MASITKRGDGQWQVKIRRKGWPAQSATFPTKKLALDWVHRTESETAAGHFVDRTAGQRTTPGELVELYLREVTEKRPGAQSRIAERSRLERFMREEKTLCADAVAILTPEQFEAYRDWRLAQVNRAGSASCRCSGVSSTFANGGLACWSTRSTRSTPKLWRGLPSMTSVISGVQRWRSRGYSMPAVTRAIRGCGLWSSWASRPAGGAAVCSICTGGMSKLRVVQ